MDLNKKFTEFGIQVKSNLIDEDIVDLSKAFSKVVKKQKPFSNKELAIEIFLTRTLLEDYGPSSIVDLVRFGEKSGRPIFNEHEKELSKLFELSIILEDDRRISRFSLIPSEVKKTLEPNHPLQQSFYSDRIEGYELLKIFNEKETLSKIIPLLYAEIKSLNKEKDFGICDPLFIEEIFYLEFIQPLTQHILKEMRKEKFFFFF